MKTTMTVIGLMSGTSLDGIDAVLVRISRNGQTLRMKVLGFETRAFSAHLRAMILGVSGGNATTPRTPHLNYSLGELFEESCLKLVSRAGFTISKVDLIGSHGQTVWHSPYWIPQGNRRIRSSFQVGELAVIAERTGVTTVGDFRPGDIAAGGEGAPLAPYFHKAFAGKKGKSRLILNMGGISNLTYLPAKPGRPVLAFDTGPGNMLIDGLLEQFTGGKMKMDRNGRMAARGKVHIEILSDLMENPYLVQKPPKSTGREIFGAPFIDDLMKIKRNLKLSAEDLTATVTAFTATSIWMNCERFILSQGPIDEVVAGGGGVRNPVLMDMLEKMFHPIPILRFEEIGLDSKAVEAMAFALFAYDTIHGTPNNLPSATGAKRSVVMGKIVPGRNYRKLIS